MRTSKAAIKIPTSVNVTILLVCLIIGVALFFPAGPSGPENSPKSRAKADVTQIATACVAYETEYGYLPPMSADGVVGGELLTSLVGSNMAHNPRKIVFIEVAEAAVGKRGGLENGRFVDPWGAPYFIAMDINYENRIRAGTNHVEVRKKVAVWNDPRLHTDTSWFGPPKKDRRYVASWE
jgi:hypothetical protein